MAEKTVNVSSSVDIAAARQIARETAIGLGFDSTAAEEIAVAVTELASNLVKHGRGGRMEFAPQDRSGGTGIRVEAHDDGPGINDVERAVTDGYSTAGSLGCGLGAVNRLMDTMEISSRPGAGTHIVCTRRVRPVCSGVYIFPLDFGIATRPIPGLEVNGDSFVIKEWDGSTLAGVIDGLGHGPLAHQAAETARHYVETHYDQPLGTIFHGVDRACRATRGVVMSLARFNLGTIDPRCNITLSFAGIGNVDARVCGNPGALHLTSRRGVLGGGAPNALVTTREWGTGETMVIHSDGLTTRWRWEDFPGLPGMGAAEAAEYLLRTLAKEDDDATVVVVKKREAPR